MKKILFLIVMVAALCSSAFAMNDLKTGASVQDGLFGGHIGCGAECDKIKLSNMSTDVKAAPDVTLTEIGGSNFGIESVHTGTLILSKREWPPHGVISRSTRFEVGWQEYTDS